MMQMLLNLYQSSINILNIFTLILQTKLLWEPILLTIFDSFTLIITISPLKLPTAISFYDTLAIPLTKHESNNYIFISPVYIFNNLIALSSEQHIISS